MTELTAPDGSITAKFVSFGATLTELWVKDRDGNTRDIVLGYDDNVSDDAESSVSLFIDCVLWQSKLLTDPDHPVFNPIVGRYGCN